MRGGFESRNEAQAAMDELKGKAARGVDVSSRLTVGQYLREWIAGKKEIKLNTLTSYTGHIDRYWEPHLGHLRLSELRVHHVSAVFDAIQEHNEQCRKGRATRPVGPASVQRIRATLRAALSDAVREGLITGNPAALVKLPAAKRPKGLVWTDDRVQRWQAQVDQLTRPARSGGGGMRLKRARAAIPTPSKVMVWRPDQLGQFLDHAAEHRLYAGVTREEAAAELECNLSKISKIETGRMTLQPAEVKNLVKLYRVPDDEAEQIFAIAREARRRVTYRVPAWVREYVGLEAEAVEIKAFQIDLIPGLLQTVDYARAITKAADPTRNPDEVERLVAIRRERQARLESDDPPQFWIVIDENALRRKVGGPEVMNAQLGYLLDVMKLPRVSIQAIPFDAGAHAAMGTAFTIFRLPEPPGGEVTVLEGLWSADYVDKDEQVRAYTEVFDGLSRIALDERGTARLITDCMGDPQ